MAPDVSDRTRARRRARVAAVALLAAMLPLMRPVAADSTATARDVRVAIILDDIGNSYRQGRAAVQLPGQVTYAVLPFTRHTSALANRAHNLGKEVMVHLPMENLARLPLGPGALYGNLTREQFDAVAHLAIDDVPWASGLNNHMGSALTQDRELMGWLMDEVGRRNFFFVDSKTTPDSVASEVARSRQIPTSSRDVFLDNERTEAAIAAQFDTFLHIARVHGTAIAIGHPYPETVAFLKNAIPRLARQGITVVPVSEILALRAAGNAAKSVATR